MGLEAPDVRRVAGRPAIRKFNPGTLQSDEAVMEQFVVRQRELGTVLEILYGNVDSPSCQHVLLVAPRGRGKTMLLARVVAALRTEEALAERLLPVRFMEESQEIFDLGDFWLETLFYLAAASTQQDPALARELRESHDDLRVQPRGDELAQRARATVLEASARLGRKLVLMVENLQSLCGDADGDFGWKLRDVLQSEPQIVLLGTATSRFEGLDDATEPFFEMFRVLALEPLTTEECGRLWGAVSGEAVSRREIRPLEILTGGSPRLLVIVAELALHRSLLRLMEELVGLIDHHTEYFRSQLEAMPKTERRVFLAVVDLWWPSSTGEVATRARLDVRAVSTMLGRLVARGAVVFEGSGRKRRYAAAERLYSIYYKLRRERDEASVVHGLIRFMAVFYSEDELAEWSGDLLAEAERAPTVREGLRRAVGELPEVGTSPGVRWLAIRPGPKTRGLARLATGEREVEEVVETAARLVEAVARGALDKADAALAACGEVIERLGDSQTPSLRRQAAGALVGQGRVRWLVGDHGPALATCDEVIDRFGDDGAMELRAEVAEALCVKASIQGQIGRAKDSISTCREMSERFGGDSVPEIRVQVATALIWQAFMQLQTGDLGAAISTSEGMIERFGSGEGIEIQTRVALALAVRGAMQMVLGDSAAVFATCDEAVERFGGSDGRELRLLCAVALAVKGVIGGVLGDAAAAISACDEMAERFGYDDASEFRTLVAAASTFKEVVQGSRSWHEAVAAVCGDLIEHLDDDDAGETRTLVAMALTLGRAMDGGMREPQAAVAVCGNLLDLLDASGVPEPHVLVAMTLLVKGALHWELGDSEAALGASDELVGRLGESDVPEIGRLVAEALACKGERQLEVDRATDALRTSQELELRLAIVEGRERRLLEWRFAWLRTRAHLASGEGSAAMDGVRSLYAAFLPGDAGMTGQLVARVPELIAAGVSERALAEVLSSDDEKSAALLPLVVGLRERIGETVSAPLEVIEVAADIRDRIDARVRAGDVAFLGGRRD